MVQIIKVLLASITYFKASLGDEVVILISKGAPATWAAVENVIKNLMPKANYLLQLFQSLCR